jgi:hypothetical protein
VRQPNSSDAESDNTGGKDLLHTNDEGRNFGGGTLHFGFISRKVDAMNGNLLITTAHGQHLQRTTILLISDKIPRAVSVDVSVTVDKGVPREREAVFPVGRAIGLEFTLHGCGK